MNPMGQSRRSQFQPIGGRRCLLLLAVVLIASAGCESGFGSRQQGDPLVGIHSSPTPLPSPGTASNPAPQASAGPIPPLPPSYTTPGTAPVAGGETAAPETGRDLRMTTDTVSPASLPATGAARGAAPGVMVGNPEPAPSSTTSNLTAPPTIAVPGTPTTAPLQPVVTAANIGTYEDAQRFLKQQGVNWQRLSGDEGEWKFACGIPNPSNPRVNKTFQTSRPFPDYLSAIREVISEIEKTPH